MSAGGPLGDEDIPAVGSGRLRALLGEGVMLGAVETPVSYALHMSETPAGRTACGEVRGDTAALRSGQALRLRLQDGVELSVTVTEVGAAVAAFETREPLHGRS